MKLQTLHESGDESGEVVGGILKQFAGDEIALISSANNHGENSGKHFIGSAMGEGLHFVPTGNLEFIENQFANRRVNTGAIEFMNGGDGSTAANVKGAALITENRAVAANASDLAMGVASNSGRTSSSNQDDGGPLTGGFESEFEVGANNHGFAGEFFLEEALHFSFGVGLTGASKARAKSGDFGGWDIRGIDSGTSGFTNGSKRTAKSDTHGIGGAAAAAGEDAGGFVHEDAFRLGATTIEAENVAHSQSILEARRE